MTEVGSLVWRPVVWVDPDATLVDAAAVLASESIGAALVRGHHQPAGIVSERDIVRSLAEGDDPAQVRVRDVMTEDLLTVPASMPVVDAVRTLVEAEVRHLVIERPEAPVHVVSLREVVASLDGVRREGAAR